MNNYESLDAAFADGAFVAVPAEIGTDHDLYPYRVAHLALEPMRVADEAGTVRRLGPGDLLSASECHAAGAALAGLVRRGRVARLPSDRGVIGLLRVLAGRL
jgi:hypothetical protein